MRICIYGAGAIGGYIGALLARSGVDVTLIARGPHLAAMRERGLTLRIGGEEIITHPRCTDDPEEAGPQDYVIVTLKAHSAPGVVERMQPLLAPETAVVTAMNGLPWWYFYGLDGPYRDRQLECLDPSGKQWRGIGPERAIGAVLWQSCELVEPGVVLHVEGNRMTIGEPDGERSDRAVALSKALTAAGLKAPVHRNIRNEIWLKLWGNLSFNPISALTHATLESIARDPGTRAAVRSMMEESRAVAENLGVEFAMSLEERIKTAESVGAHKTSMLQDLEQGRPMEIDALVGVVSELGRLVSVPTPTIDVVYALIVQRAREAGRYPP